MTGGLIQLVAYSKQDLFLTHDPQITFFKVVYRRHTNFTLEVIPQNFLHPPNFGRRVSSVLSRNGDLIRKIHLVIDLPSIPVFKDGQDIDLITKFAWVRRIGYALIKTVDIEIGGELIDRQYGDWLNIWHELTLSNKQNLDEILGNIKELTDFTNGKKTYRLMIPLKFWFNRVAGLALPIVSLQYNHIKINLELNDFDNCHVISPTHYIEVGNALVNFEQYEYLVQTVNGQTAIAQFNHFDILNKRLYFTRISNNAFQAISTGDADRVAPETYGIIGTKTRFIALPATGSVEKIHKNRSVDFDTISIKNCFLLVEYAFLDDEERIRFSRARHEYLIEQLVYNGEETVDGLHQSFKIGFTQACKEVIWVSQLNLVKKASINDSFNYTDSPIRDYHTGELKGKNIILEETILFNGHDRITMRDSAYFNYLQPYQHHSHSPSEGINVYSFCIHPENHQPSGTANFSKIDNVDLRILVSPDINLDNTAVIRIYGIVYNILRVSNGVSGLVFAIDY
jgi:hypothetical protein